MRGSAVEGAQGRRHVNPKSSPPLPLPSVPRVMELAGYCRLLEDLLELGTIRDCGEIFACMEADLEVWGGAVGIGEGNEGISRHRHPLPLPLPPLPQFLGDHTRAAQQALAATAAAAAAGLPAPKAPPPSPTHFTILRSCNGLLKRLSKV